MAKAAVLTALDTPLEIRTDVEVEPPRAGEVKVRMGASGVCHSDLSMQNGTIMSAMPVVLGHEGAGVIEEVGEGVNTADIRRGDTVAVIGCGGVGLNVIQGARIAGADRIIAVDQVETKLALAKEFGATDTVNAGQVDAVGQVMGMTSQRGADVAFEVIGLGPTID